MLMEPEELIEQVERRLSYSSNIDNEDLRTEEYLNFVEATDSPPSDSSTREFRVRRQIVPTSLGGLIETLVKVERLKEVRVQTGFSRIVPPALDMIPTTKSYCHRRRWTGFQLLSFRERESSSL